MHDWTRVDPNDYHTFHFAWIASILHALNARLLPPGYFAMADHTTPPVIPDLVTLSIPDDRPPESLRAASATTGAAVAELPKAAIIATETGKEHWPAGRRRIAIKHARNRQIVAVIEIVSPSNKSAKPEFADLLEKSVQLLRQGIHLMLIDPFPPTSRDPRGIHAALWKELTGKKFTPPEGKPLTVAA